MTPIPIPNDDIGGAGRRDYDSGGAMVVPLREYLEDKIQAQHDKFTAEIKHVRADVATAQAQATQEHTVVQGQLLELTQTVRELRDTDHAQNVSFKTIRAIAVLVAAVATLVSGGIGAIVALL